MRPLLLTLSLIVALASAHAEVVRLAPDFTFPGIGKSQSLKGVRGQPVVLLIAKSPKIGDFKTEVKNLGAIYQEFANKQAIFIVAFISDPAPVKSNIPFVVANNGAAVASAYSMPEKDKFNIVIIGKDGNVDYQTSKVIGAQRVVDVIQNSFAVQSITGR
ncbi:MAG: redoxin domain-containing protein [Chthoniobacter sp.]|nr:redoxin domain-containing protein [Chthoniobacter sp.]